MLGTCGAGRQGPRSPSAGPKGHPAPVPSATRAVQHPKREKSPPAWGVRTMRSAFSPAGPRPRSQAAMWRWPGCQDLVPVRYGLQELGKLTRVVDGKPRIAANRRCWCRRPRRGPARVFVPRHRPASPGVRVRRAWAAGLFRQSLVHLPADRRLVSVVVASGSSAALRPLRLGYLPVRVPSGPPPSSEHDMGQQARAQQDEADGQGVSMVTSAARPRTCASRSGACPVNRPAASTHTITARPALVSGGARMVPACRVPSGAVQLACTVTWYWRYPGAGAVAASTAGTCRQVAC
jgi:hypothetical protein